MMYSRGAVEMLNLLKLCKIHSYKPIGKTSTRGKQRTHSGYNNRLCVYDKIFLQFPLTSVVFTYYASGSHISRSKLCHRRINTPLNTPLNVQRKGYKGGTGMKQKRG